MEIKRQKVLSKNQKRTGMKMKKLDLLYEGKAKKVYTTDDPDVLIVDYKDDSFWRRKVFRHTLSRSSATARQQ